MNIGLTGGIACGKSTVAQMLVAKGAVLIDADQVAREVVLPGTPALALIAEQFGPQVIQEDGSLDRKALGQQIFHHEPRRKQLEQILHPRIRALMTSRMEQAEKDKPDRLVVADVPLLYESGLVHHYDKVMVVYVPEAMQISRLMKRDGLSEQEAMSRIQAQLPIEEKKGKADYVIDNSGSLEQTRKQVDAFWESMDLL